METLALISKRELKLIRSKCHRVHVHGSCTGWNFNEPLEF